VSNALITRGTGTPAAKSARIMVIGSPNWNDRHVAYDSVNASLMLLGAALRISVVVHGGEPGADRVVSEEALSLGLHTEVHPAYRNAHTEACSDADRSEAVCAMASIRRYGEMVAAGADLCLVYVTHGYQLAPGEDPTGTSREAWAGAEAATRAGIPTIVVWGDEMFPFGDAARELLRRDAEVKEMTPGPQGQVSILSVWLPF
jgi:hypothetical protein